MKDLLFGAQNDPAFEHGWSFVYFHGEADEVINKKWNTSLDQWCAPDLVSASVPRDEVEDGIHEGSVYGVPVTLFLWTTGTAERIVEKGTPGAYVKRWVESDPLSSFWVLRVPSRHGLICLTTGDDSALVYAQKQYEEKAQHL